MATKFLEPGGDATFNATTLANDGLWDSILGTPAIATDFVHGGHIKSLKYRAGFADGLACTSGASNSGSRVSIYIYINTLPNATATFLSLRNGSNTKLVSIRLTTAGVLQVWNAETAQIGTDGATLSTGHWYRVCLATTFTSTIVNRIELFVDAVSSNSITNATLTAISPVGFQVGNPNTDATFDLRSSDHYMDDSSALTDTGNIWVTAKRPNANGTLNEFTTQIGAGGSGYGSGHSPQVNERIFSVTNGWSISTTTKKTEEYSIENVSTGDIDITGATIIDYMGWIISSVDSGLNSPVHHIIVGGVATSKTISVATSQLIRQIANSSTYPTGNTDIGIDAQFTTTPHLTSLFECGIVVAYIPAVVTTNSNFLAFM